MLKFLGLYKQRRKEFEVTFIVSPWMDNGNVSEYLSVKVAQGEPIPRIRWVRITACSYNNSTLILLQIYEIACGLKYLHDERVVHGALHGVSNYFWFSIPSFVD